MISRVITLSYFKMLVFNKKNYEIWKEARKYGPITEEFNRNHSWGSRDTELTR